MYLLILVFSEAAECKEETINQKANLF